MNPENPQEAPPATSDAQRPRPAARPMGPIREVWAFLRVRKKFWLAPIIIVLIVLGLLMWLAGSAGVVSPFIYAL